MADHPLKFRRLLLFLAVSVFALLLTSGRTQEPLGQAARRALNQSEDPTAKGRTEDPPIRSLSRQLAHFRSVGDLENAARVFDKLFPPDLSGDLASLLKSGDAGVSDRFDQGEIIKPVVPAEGAYPVFVSPEPEKAPSADFRRTAEGELAILSAAEEWPSGRASGIRVRKSTDGGLTWPETRAVGAGRALAHPSLRRIRDGLFGLAYEREWDIADRDISFARFSEDLTAWVESPVALSLKDERNPALATDAAAFADPYLYLVYTQRDGTTVSIKVRVSPDLGASWSREVTVDAFPCPEDADVPTAIAYDPLRNILHIAYARPQDASGRIVTASSSSFGAAWSRPTALTPPGIRAGVPAIAAGGGTVIVLYERSDGSASGDIGLVYSKDSGRRWASGADLAATAARESSPDIRASEGAGATKFFASFVEDDDRVRTLSATNAAPGSWTSEGTYPREEGSITLGRAIVLALPGPDGADVAGTFWTDTTADDDVYFSATVIPLSLATLTVTPSNRDVPFTAGTTTFAVGKSGAGQVSWTAAVTAGGDWLSITSGASGTNAGTITAEFLENPGPVSRSGSIQVTPTNTAIPSVTVTVNQSGAPLLAASPAEGFVSQGDEGGPFSPASMAYSLQNAGGSVMTWTATAAAWLTLTPASGSLDPGATVAVTVAVDADANGLAVGTYGDTLAFTNTTNGAGTTARPVTLTVNARPGTLAVTPAEGFDAAGVVGGPFTPPSKDYVLQNIGATTIDWAAGATGGWLSLSAASGTLGAGASVTVTVAITAAAEALSAGVYGDEVSFANTTNARGSTTRAVTVTVTTPGALEVTPSGALISSGTVGGPFTPSSQVYTLRNGGGTAIAWTAANTETWTSVSVISGTLEPGTSTTVAVSINAEAEMLAAGGYADTVYFTNATNGTGTTTRAVDLTVVAPGVLEVLPVEGLAATGLTGGPFTPSSQSYLLSNRGGAPMSWTAAATRAWTSLSATSGTLDVGHGTYVTVSINDGANTLAAGTYNDIVTFTNTTNGSGDTTRPVILNVIAPGALLVSPAGGLASSGLVGGPFTPSVQAYSLQNTGGTEIGWTAAKTQPWTTLSNTSGTLGAGATTMVAVTITAAANALPAGTYNDTVTFANATNGSGDTTRPVALTITTPGLLSITPSGGLASTGPVAGPFAPSSLTYTLQNSGGTALSWMATKTQAWTTLSSGSGSLPAGASTTVTVSINAGANGLAAGTYADTVSFVDQTFGVDPIIRPVSLTVAAPGVLTVLPAGGLSAAGFTGGPFTPSSLTYTLQNTGGTAIGWSAARTQTWTSLSAASGTLGAGNSTTVTVSIGPGADTLPAGSYADTVSFNNTTDGSGNATRAVSLTITAPPALTVTPADGLVSAGFAGGPFTPSSKIYTLLNTGGATVTWNALRTQTWTSLSAPGGTLTAGQSTTVTVSINTWANALDIGSYTDTVTFTNATNGNGTTGRNVSLTVGTVPALSVTPAARDVAFLAGATTFDVANTGGGTMAWAAAVVAGGDWLTITSGTNGTEDGTITAAFTANRTASARVGIVRVTAAGASGSPRDVTVVQARASLGLSLGAERLVERAWIVQREYARLSVAVANPAGIPVDQYVISRQAGNGPFQVRAQVSGATAGGTSWTYNDTFLETGTAYSYRIVALDALGNVISESNLASI